jgi:hypothetical protein
MLTLRRFPEAHDDDPHAIVDCEFGAFYVTLTLIKVNHELSFWKIESNDWMGIKYTPREIALTNNQPLYITDWLTIYGSRMNENGEAVIHFKANENATINRRDRIKNA